MPPWGNYILHGAIIFSNLLIVTVYISPTSTSTNRSRKNLACKGEPMVCSSTPNFTLITICSCGSRNWKFGNASSNSTFCRDANQQHREKLELAATLRWFTAGGAIRIAVRQLSQTWKFGHYDVIDDVITRKL